LPRRRKKSFTRLALPANELQAKILELIQPGETRRKIKGVAFVYVGSLGSEANWFARPLPVRISEKCMREFVSALAQVRKVYDLLFDPDSSTATVLFSESLATDSSVPAGAACRPAHAFRRL
jgi:hypothetical protein